MFSRPLQLVHACELIAQRAGVSAHELDNWLWTRGQACTYKARPRHRCRCVYHCIRSSC